MKCVRIDVPVEKFTLRRMSRRAAVLTILCFSSSVLSYSSFRCISRAIRSPSRFIQNMQISDAKPSYTSAMPLLKLLNSHANVILASASPRRKELLTLMGIENFSIRKSDFAEDLVQSQYPLAESYCLATAVAKADDVVREIEKVGHRRIGTILIGADTIVEINGKILEKPRDEEEAYQMLSSLSGQTHVVHTAVVVYGNGQVTTSGGGGVGVLVPMTSFVESTSVKFIELGEEDKAAYIQSREGFDKSGGYGIQGLGGQMVEKIDGCYFNVMGFPISRLSKELAILHNLNKI